jgi:hypothetical protein
MNTSSNNKPLRSKTTALSFTVSGVFRSNWARDPFETTAGGGVGQLGLAPAQASAASPPAYIQIGGKAQQTRLHNNATHIVIGLAIAVNVASVVNQQIQVPEVSFSGLRVPRHLTELVPAMQTVPQTQSFCTNIPAAVFQLRNSGQEVGPDVADLRPA